MLLRVEVLASRLACVNLDGVRVNALWMRCTTADLNPSLELEYGLLSGLLGHFCHKPGRHHEIDVQAMWGYG